MSDQQRLFLAVCICTALWMGWIVLQPPRPVLPEPPSIPATTEPTAPGAAAPVAAPGVESKVGAGPEVDTVVVPVVEHEISNGLLRATVRNQPLALSRLELTQFADRPTDDGPSGPLILTADAEATASRGVTAGQAQQATVRWKLDGPVPSLQLSPRDGDGAVLTGRSQGGLQLQAVIALRPDAYAIDYDLTVTNMAETAQAVGAAIELRITQPENGSSFLSGPGMQYRGVCSFADSVERLELSDLEDGPFTSEGVAHWIAIDRQYFVVAAYSQGESQGFCEMAAVGQTVVVTHRVGGELLQPGQIWKHRWVVYAGPKSDAALEAVAPELKLLVDYDIWGIPLGFIARPMVAMLNFFHAQTGSWGLAIIFLTLSVKLLLFFPSYKSQVSMRQMQLLKPEQDKIKERFPDDRERQQKEQMALYKDRGINPLGGCLPMLMQMPVWFALYRALWTSVDLYQQSFLWLPDLTAKEPGFPVLALILGVVMFGQQLLTPMSVDSQQAKMMKWMMPIMMVFFMIALPSGLVLYILINSVLSVGQQLVINWRIGPKQTVSSTAQPSTKPTTVKARKPKALKAAK